MDGPAILLLSRQAPGWFLAALAFALLVPPGTRATSAKATTLSGAVCGTWSVVPSPPSSSANAYLEGTVASAQNDVWAVGHRSNYSDTVWQPLFEHWNGTAWTAVASPSRSGRLYAVTALSRTSAWAVGEGPIVAHWNGARWSTVPSPQVTHDYREPARLLAVAATSAHDVWAVGLNYHYSTRQLIEHWNGGRWRVVPGVPSGSHTLQAMAALSAKDIWAVGDGVEHWNGSRWALLSASVKGSAIAALSDSNVWVVHGGTIKHWDGSAWRSVPAPASGEQFTSLTGITALSATDIWAVGYAGHTVPHDGYAEHPFALHWNGSVWRVEATAPTGAPDSQLLAVTSVRPHTVWAVGFSGTHRAGNVHALIEHFDRCRG